MSDSVQPHRQQLTRLPRSWDSPGKNTEWVAISISTSIRLILLDFFKELLTETFTLKDSHTSFWAISRNRRGRRLTLWLMALRLMCRGKVWKTSELEDFWVTAFNMALISAARAWAKVEAVKGNSNAIKDSSWINTFLGRFRKENRF